MDVTKVLKDSWQAVLDSGVPDEVREVAFNRAVDLYGYAPTVHSPIVAPPPSPTGSDTPPPPGSGTPPSSGGGGTDEDTFYTKLTKETEVPRERLESVVHLDDGIPKIAISAKKIPIGKKAGQLFIARVILTARAVVLEETETKLSEVRSECERYGVLDRNFSANVKSIDDAGITLTGSGHNQKAKVRKNYISDFGTFLNQALGAADASNGSA
ncbi:hypothetical protein [Mycolicibacterium sp. YH-1]|uniref:hypothetical protein n=1 Tax=Mycolicibacterium sp. YH-1 TaxID=2908837 RepID=UPI001F4C0800|nr:hypothetical protein [Mycolicibacterium sp. YH-1]UNB54849.1 hypothetical protein L0M16_11330 [Mycolicibacterium sp. YH-1]